MTTNSPNRSPTFAMRLVWHTGEHKSMAITFTSNKGLTLVTVGTEVGTWGPYVNGDQTLLDNMLGGIATIALTNVNVQLSSAQYANVFVKLTGAITGNIQLTFPGGVGGFWTIMNQTTNSSNFFITLVTTAAGSQTIGVPPNDNTRILLDGTNPQFHGLPHPVGAYWDHAGSSVPAWVGNCTVPPYLNCDGSAFAAATYPALNNFLGGNTLPDLRGRSRIALDQGTARNGLSFLQSSGAATVTLQTSNLPAHGHTVTVTDPGHVHGNPGVPLSGGGTNLTISAAGAVTNINTNSAFTGITAVANNTGQNNSFSALQPSVAHGLTLIRAG